MAATEIKLRGLPVLTVRQKFNQAEQEFMNARKERGEADMDLAQQDTAVQRPRQAGGSRLLYGENKGE